MSTSDFVTESWLRRHFGLAHGSEIHLPAGARLTPAAGQLLAERKVRVKYLGDDGRAYLRDEHVHPLTGANKRPGNRCVVCGSQVQRKTELLTLLDDRRLVPKTHPRIALRGKLDTLIAQTVVVQTQFDREDRYSPLRKLLADLRSYMGNVLRSEVSGEALLPLGMGDMNAATIHAISHQPLEYLGRDHLLPDRDHGADIALLNLLRALAREAELAAVRVFVDDAFELSREDIVQGLNRLSSALYVLMLLRVLSESDVERVLQKLSSP